MMKLTVKARQEKFAHTRRLAKLAALSATVLALQACGGGSEDDDGVAELHDFSGQYSLALQKSQDSCNTGAQQSVSLSQSVRQEGRSIALDSGSMTVGGSVEADNQSFRASDRQSVQGVTVELSFTYRTTATAGAYTVEWRTMATAQGQTCTLVYQGQAQRG